MDDLAQQGVRRVGHDITSGTENARYVGGSKRPCRVSIPKRLVASRVASRVKVGQVRGEEKTTSTQLRSRRDSRQVLTRRERGGEGE